MNCKLCNGVLLFLGSLGNMKWMRCRDCGMEDYFKTRKRALNRAPKREVAREDEVWRAKWGDRAAIRRANNRTPGKPETE